MKRKKFELWHSVAGLAVILGAEVALARYLPAGVATWLLLALAAAGAIVAMYVSTEAIEEVRNANRMLVLLSIISAEFIVFFMGQYWLLISISPASFPTLPAEASSLALQSIMVFVFNPLYLPGDFMGRMLLIINTASALGLVLFILQNVWQFRREGKQS